MGALNHQSQDAQGNQGKTAASIVQEPLHWAPREGTGLSEPLGKNSYTVILLG
jgi:hypothetical protein